MITPYKVEVVQGNFISKEQVEALQPGMSREQVRQILGTPLVSSVFHGDRWDYVFTIKRKGVEAQRRQLTVFFKEDRMDRVEGDPMPSEPNSCPRWTTPQAGQGAAPGGDRGGTACFPKAAPPRRPSGSAGAGAQHRYPPLEPAR